MVKTRRFRGGKKSKRHLHHKRRKHHSTHRRKVKRHSRRGTKRRQRTKRVKRGGARKYIMKGGGYYVITDDQKNVLRTIDTGGWVGRGTKDPKAIQEKLKTFGYELRDVELAGEFGKDYKGVEEVTNVPVTITRYSNATAARRAAADDDDARDARDARKKKEGDMRAEMIGQLAQKRKDKVDRSAVLDAMQREGHGADDGGWRMQHGLAVGVSGKTKD
jgi:hypothetical protein